MPQSKAEYTSDVLVDVLKALGIEYASLNPGASVRGIHDSIVNYGGNKSPELILCCHENIAVSIASGYFRATGKPMAVLIHDLGGLMHASKAIWEAFLGREAMLLIGGNGPVDAAKRRPGIDWIHTAVIPNTLVRDYVKWDDQPQGLTSCVEALIRAHRLSISEPAGPVYLSIDSDFQEERLEAKAAIPSVEAYPPVTVGEGSLAALESVADLLVEAESPVFMVDSYGARDKAVMSLVKLAEKVGAAVVDSGTLFNFPSNHPLNQSDFRKETLDGADTVVLLGVKDIHQMLAAESKGHFSRESELMVRPDCKIVRVDMETVSINSWVQEYGRLTPTTLTIAANPEVAVQRLLQLCSDRLATEDEKRERISNRMTSLGAKVKALRAEALESAKSLSGRSPVELSSLALAVWEAVRSHDWVLAFPDYTGRGVNLWTRRIWEISKAYQYPGRVGNTGTGIGRAIGVSLANKGRLCIDFQPDGDLLYSASGLWTAANSKIPFLIIMLNNHSYYNDEEHQKAVATFRGRPVGNASIGIRIEDPDVDFAGLAKDYGLDGSGPIKTIDELKPALEKGIASVTKGSKAYLIDVHTQPR